MALIEYGSPEDTVLTLLREQETILGSPVYFQHLRWVTEVSDTAPNYANLGPIPRSEAIALILGDLLDKGLVVNKMDSNFGFHVVGLEY